MKIDFLIFDHVEELDLVGSWELIGLLSNQDVCHKPKLISVDSMTPTGEHGFRQTCILKIWQTMTCPMC